MRAMILNSTGLLSDNPNPLQWVNLRDPIAGAEELLIRVSVCGVCHTELDEIEGRTPPPQLPIILGHQVVGVVEARGQDVKEFEIGDRVVTNTAIPGSKRQCQCAFAHFPGLTLRCTRRLCVAYGGKDMPHARHIFHRVPRKLGGGKRILQ